MNELLEASTKQLTKHLEQGNIIENEIALNIILDELSQLQQEKEELINWLEEEITRIHKLINPKKYIKPYGTEKHLHENTINIYRDVLSKLKESDK